jgi:hypothetical protein
MLTSSGYLERAVLDLEAEIVEHRPVRLCRLAFRR